MQCAQVVDKKKHIKRSDILQKNKEREKRVFYFSLCCFSFCLASLQDFYVGVYRYAGFGALIEDVYGYDFERCRSTVRLRAECFEWCCYILRE